MTPEEREQERCPECKGPREIRFADRARMDRCRNDFHTPSPEEQERVYPGAKGCKVTDRGFECGFSSANYARPCDRCPWSEKPATPTPEGDEAPGER